MLPLQRELGVEVSDILVLKLRLRSLLFCIGLHSFVCLFVSTCLLHGSLLSFRILEQIENKSACFELLFGSGDGDLILGFAFSFKISHPGEELPVFISEGEQID